MVKFITNRSVIIIVIIIIIIIIINNNINNGTSGSIFTEWLFACSILTNLQM